MKISLHPAAEQDIQDAAAFYEREGSAVLARRFVSEFKQLSSLLIRHPELGAPRSGGR
jgi:toxin ParE1/3/4